LTSRVADAGTVSGEGAAKPVVLIFRSCYWPAFKSGGPVQTLRNLVRHLGHALDFRIVTADRDRGEETPFRNVAINQWNDVEGARVYYADPAHRSLGHWRSLVSVLQPRIVYLNSFFDPVFTIEPLLLRRLGLVDRRIQWLLAPRGEFAPAALALESGKKRAFMRLAPLLGLHRGLRWQASSLLEAQDIHRAMGVAIGDIVVAPNLPALFSAVPEAERTRGPGEPLSVCFLSRIAPMKNLDFALQVLHSVRSRVDFHVYGPPVDPEYYAACRNRAATLGPHVRVEFHGDVPHELVGEMLARHDLYFLPTRGENYGHAIVEALGAGLPVLISDRTPWLDLEARGAGWALPLGQVELFVAVIEAVANMDEAARHALARGARAYADQIASSSGVVEANRRLFFSLLDPD
jgi:glycosyltransferase involved in cell wall biosynthesis